MRRLTIVLHDDGAGDDTDDDTDGDDMVMMISNANYTKLRYYELPGRMINQMEADHDVQWKPR